MEKTDTHTRIAFSFSQAEKLAGLACLVAIPLFAVNSGLALVPLVIFLLLCVIAPFFPQWSFFLPIISKSITKSKAIALTFDDGPSPVTTPIILQLLKQYNYKATFFVIGEKAEHYPDLITDILADGHTIGNHSWRHDSLLMLKTKKRLGEDIRKTQKALQNQGVWPLLFRPPAGATNPRLKSVLRAENLRTVTYSCRPFDFGNRKINNLAERVSSKLKPGDIVLLHDISPEKKEQTVIWQNEISILFADLHTKKTDVAPLENLIGFPVMKRHSDPDENIL